MKSVVTSKYQTTIPKSVRAKLKLSINDTLEWKVEKGKMVVYPIRKKFLEHKNAIRIGTGDFRADIDNARTVRIEKCR